MEPVKPADLEEHFRDYARTLLQIEMKKRQLGYRELTEKLNVGGINENERNVRNKVARGTFSAGFFVHCLIAMGCEVLPLGFHMPGKGFGLYIENYRDRTQHSEED